MRRGKEPTEIRGELSLNMPFIDKNYIPCKHRWQPINKIFRDRLNWITAQKCRKCGRKEQTTYRADLDQNMRITCKTEQIHEMGLKTQEIDQLNQNDAINQPNNNAT